MEIDPGTFGGSDIKAISTVMVFSYTKSSVDALGTQLARLEHGSWAAASIPA